jgi:hypothetical protein
LYLGKTLFHLAKPFVATWCCSKASPSVVPWELPIQFEVVLGVISCGWVVNHGGACGYQFVINFSFILMSLRIVNINLSFILMSLHLVNLNLSFIFMSLHLINESNPNGSKRFHANLVCHGMCKLLGISWCEELDGGGNARRTSKGASSPPPATPLTPIWVYQGLCHLFIHVVPFFHPIIWSYLHFS